MGPHDVDTGELEGVLKRCIADEDAGALGAVILRALGATGYLHVRQRVPAALFEATAAGMGSISSRTEIRVDKELDSQLRKQRSALRDRPSVFDSAPLDFHTDHPTVPIIGWYCHQQDEVGGATELVNARDLPERFSPGELAAMCRLTLRRIDVVESEQVFSPHPLLCESDDGYDLYYTPWLRFDASTPEETELFGKLDAYLRDKSTRDPLRVRLAPGECLFIDNRRVLHARGQLPPDSRRHLTRLYIQRSLDRRPSSHVTR